MPDALYYPHKKKASSCTHFLAYAIQFVEPDASVRPLPSSDGFPRLVLRLFCFQNHQRWSHKGISNNLQYIIFTLSVMHAIRTCLCTKNTDRGRF